MKNTIKIFKKYLRYIAGIFFSTVICFFFFNLGYNTSSNELKKEINKKNIIIQNLKNKIFLDQETLNSLMYIIVEENINYSKFKTRDLNMYIIKLLINTNKKIDKLNQK